MKFMEKMSKGNYINVNYKTFSNPLACFCLLISPIFATCADISLLYSKISKNFFHPMPMPITV